MGRVGDVNHVQGYLHYSYVHVCTFISGDGKHLTCRTEKDKQTKFNQHKRLENCTCYFKLKT